MARTPRKTTSRRAQPPRTYTQQVDELAAVLAEIGDGLSPRSLAEVLFASGYRRPGSAPALRKALEEAIKDIEWVHHHIPAVDRGIANVLPRAVGHIRDALARLDRPARGRKPVHA